MTSPLVVLREAIRLWLLSDASLVTMLHGSKILDAPLKHVAFPYVAFISSRALENGTSSDEGHVIELTLGIWSRHNGNAEGLSLASAIESRLAQMPSALDGHHLVNLLVRSVEPLRLKDDQTWLCQLRIRAVTEVI